MTASMRRGDWRSARFKGRRAMADKANPFRDHLYEALGRRGVRWERAFGAGRHAELHSLDNRWLGLIVQKCLSRTPWWNIPHYFEGVRAAQRRHPSYLVLQMLQDMPESGTMLESQELEKLFVDGSADRFGNVKVLPGDLA